MIDRETVIAWGILLAMVCIPALLSIVFDNPETPSASYYESSADGSYEDYQDRELELEDRVSDLEQDLDTANGRIEDLNYQIEDASGYAWSDYDTMSETLESLTTRDTVD